MFRPVPAFEEYRAACAQLRLLLALRAGECASDADEQEEWDAPPGPGEEGEP